VRDQELEAGEEQNWVEPFRVATLRREAISSRNQSAGAGDAPRGVASRARSRRQLECSGVPRVKPSCSHFLVCAANGFVELSPGKQPDNRAADAAAMAMRMVRRTGISGSAPLRPEMGLVKYMRAKQKFNRPAPSAPAAPAALLFHGLPTGSASPLAAGRCPKHSM
jgi:hypothetical protein